MHDLPKVPNYSFPPATISSFHEVHGKKKKKKHSNNLVGNLEKVFSLAKHMGQISEWLNRASVCYPPIPNLSLPPPSLFSNDKFSMSVSLFL